MATSVLPQLGRQPDETINWKHCIVCQQEAGQLVLQPRLESYRHLLSVIQERASLHDGAYIQIYQRLKDHTTESLKSNKAVWHRTCYSAATHKLDIQRARDRYQRSLSTGSYAPKERGRPSSHDMSEPSTYDDMSTPFTRSATKPLKKDMCFFCQTSGNEKLFAVRTDNAGEALKRAVMVSSNCELKTRLASCISEGDAHAIDVQYHKDCWRENVFHILRDEASTSKRYEKSRCPLQTASFIELVNLIDVQTRSGAYLSMEDIDTSYVNMLGGVEVLATHKPAYCRKWLKQQILSELPHVKSTVQSNRRKSAVLYCPDACEAEMIQGVITSDDTDDMKTLYRAAQLVRKSIEGFTKKPPQAGHITVSSTTEDVPVELYTLIRWIMAGPADKLETEARTYMVDRAALTISQNLMFGFKSKRQVNYRPKAEHTGFRSRRKRENPQVVGLALTVHHNTRNKKLMNLLNALDYCVSHGRTLMMETALANAIVKNTEDFKGLYLPPFLKKGSFVFFAVDNTDFSEDTAVGKGTTHGTITAVYQKEDALGEPIASSLNISDAQGLSVIPHHTAIMPCAKPKQSDTSDNEGTREFVINREGVDGNCKLTHLGWVLASALSRMKDGDSSLIPGWAGYNSLLSTSQPLTKVGALPLLPEVAHEWSTLLTVMTQARTLKEFAVGEKYLTVVTFDMALYEKAVRLVDSRSDLKGKLLPRLGELHAVMAALRALGASIENSGIDDAWMEAGLYGSATTRQILRCTHYKRSLRAHIYSYMALYELALEQFFLRKS